RARGLKSAPARQSLALPLRNWQLHWPGKLSRVFLGKLFAAGVFSMTTALSGLRMQLITPAELSQLLAAHGAALALFARQRCSSPEDVVQEAFVALARQSPPPDDPVAWLYRTVRNGAASAARAAGRRRRRETEAGALRSNWFEPADENVLDAQLATAALAALPLEERETVVLRLWSGLTFAQIAELANSSTSTVHRRYETALAALRGRLQADKSN
ncbi:MAG: sigma-70 family RNA polymerase sigma factor, partial [Planctomycetales bacterium]|nr:sigma-70 family RNA polymerase sigma factor [Planctomycetales bacterium]